MNKIHSRLTVSLGFLILIVMLCLSFLLGQYLKTVYNNQFEQKIVEESKYVATILKERTNLNELTEADLKEISRLFNVDLLLIKDEKLLFQSNQFIYLAKSNHDIVTNWANSISNKSEVLTITQNNEAISLSKVPVGNRYQIGDTLILLKSGIEATNTSKKLAKILIISFLLSFLIIIFYSSIILRRTLGSIDIVKDTISKLTKGNFSPPIDDLQKAPQSKLSKLVEKLIITLQNLVEKQRIQQDHLSTLVENIGSGLIFIDGHGFINLVNQTYKQIFQQEFENYANKPYYEVIEFAEVNEIIEEIFMTEQNVRRQITLPIKIERRHFEVYGAPIIGKSSSWKGVLLVFHDITELKKLEKTRKDFVANVSHELKTPITSIKGFSETLLDGASGDKEVLEQFLSIILKESDRLQSLLQDLLDLSKIEEDDFKLSIQKFDIVLLLKEIITLLKQNSKDKNITLLFSPEIEELYIDADLDLIKQLFINLISNAITYTYEDGTVEVTVTQDSNEIVVNVSDTGIGVDPDEIPRIFERFYRVDRARSRDSGGTGLGLAIVKHIVEAHKGEILVKSIVGEGTTFTIILPNNLI